MLAHRVRDPAPRSDSSFRPPRSADRLGPLLLLLVAGALLVTGCAGSRPAVMRPTPGEVPGGFPEHDAGTIQSSIAASGDSLRSIFAVADVRVRTSEIDESYRTVIRQRREDSLVFSVSPGWGIQAARGLATPDSVFLHDRFRHELYVGSFTTARRLLPGIDSLETLFANLTGTLRPSPRRNWQVRADSSFYYLEARYEDRREIYVVNPSLWRVVRYQIRSEDGRLLEEREFSGYRRTTGGFFLPQQIRVRRPPEDQELTVRYESTTANPVELELAFRVDPTVKRIPLEQPR